MTLTDGWEPPRPGWTCAECGFDYDTCQLASAPDAIRGLGRRYRAPLTRGLPGEDLVATLRSRPSAHVWSALEYACHVRDVMALYEARIVKAITEDHPEVAAMGRDALVVERSYNSQLPAEVAEELAGEAERLAERLSTVTDGEWDRTVVRDGQHLSVGWMARNSIHEGSHHLLDIGRVLRQARGR